MGNRLIDIEKFSSPQSRWRSKTAWLSLISFVLLAVKLVFKIELPPYVDELINSLFAVLTMFGIWNNPTDGNNY